jgi:phosphopantetheinyl transferase (holo-ACP synthase)
VKALGLMEGFGLREIEVVAGEPPQVRLSGRAADAAAERGVEVRVSLTHSRDFAAAVAVAETR